MSAVRSTEKGKMKIYVWEVLVLKVLCMQTEESIYEYLIFMSVRDAVSAPMGFYNHRTKTQIQISAQK